MSFQSEALDAWEAMLELMQEEAPKACVLRFPVTKLGTDQTGAADYDCLPSPSPDRIDLVEGGFIANYQFSVSARVDDFETVPVSGELVLKNGRASRVLYTEVAELSPLILLHCGTPEK